MSPVWIGLRCPGMKTVQAVEIGDFAAVHAAQGCQRQQAKGLGPEIVGRKIVYPGINKENARFVWFHFSEG